MCLERGKYWNFTHEDLKNHSRKQVEILLWEIYFISVFSNFGDNTNSWAIEAFKCLTDLLLLIIT